MDVTIQAIAKGFDRQVPLIRQPFYYYPFMYDKILLGQTARKTLYEKYAR